MCALGRRLVGVSGGEFGICCRVLAIWDALLDVSGKWDLEVVLVILQVKGGCSVIMYYIV